MRKLLAILLSLIVLFSSTGITLATHLCGGNAVDLQVLYGIADVGCGMEDQTPDPCPDNQQTFDLNVKSCCDDLMATIDIDEYNLQLLKAVNIPFIVALAATSLNPYTFQSEKQTGYLNYSPPLLEQDIPVLHQVFLL